MPTPNRSLGRDVHIYNANDPTIVLGGLRLTNGVKNASFYSMVNTIVITKFDYFLRDENDTKIEKNDHPFLPENYYIVTIGSLSINDESFLIRTISHATGTRVRAFCDAVRSRDRFETAHMFPLTYEGLWNQFNFGRWITIEPQRGRTSNSVQNGMLLTRDIHDSFDNYVISINPDDNYKVVAFARESKGIAGTYFNQKFLSHPQRPVDQLLRWHFRQAVLVNMKGAGEPVFEHDFPPVSNIIGDILTGPKAAKRMEYEIFSRLATQTETISTKDT